MKERSKCNVMDGYCKLLQQKELKGKQNFNKLQQSY